MSKRQLAVTDHLKGGRVLDLSKFAKAPEPEYTEPYGDELPKIQAVGARINALFARKKINNDEWPELIERIITMYDEIGWEVGVEIMDALHKDGTPILSQDGFPMRVPSIALLGRTGIKETEADHDRIKHNTVNGLYDGKKGYIDPNTGQLREDPKRKLIY